MEILREEVEEEGITFSASLIEVENAVIAFFVEGEKLRLGTLAIALPTGVEGSSILLGEKLAVISRILAERIALAYGKIALVSTFSKSINEAKAELIFVKLGQRILSKRSVSS